MGGRGSWARRARAIGPWLAMAAAGSCGPACGGRFAPAPGAGGGDAQPDATATSIDDAGQSDDGDAVDGAGGIEASGPVEGSAATEAGGPTDAEDEGVAPEAALVSIVVLPGLSTLMQGDAAQLHAMAYDSDGTSRDVTTQAVWASDTPNVAVGATPGQVVAVTPGQSTVSATFEGVRGTATVAVTSPEIVGIAVAPSYALLNVACTASITFDAIATFTNMATGIVTSDATWSSRDAQIATVGAHTGVAVLPDAPLSGTTTILASYLQFEASAILTVDPLRVSAVQLAPATATLGRGAAEQFQATQVLPDGSSCAETDALRWESSDPDVATVSPAGLVTAVGPGSATVTATDLTFGVSGTSQVVVP